MIARILFCVLTIVFYSVSVLSLKPFDIDGVKYILSDPVKKNWYQANRYCRQKGMYLLDFDSDEEHTKMRQYLRDHINDLRIGSLWVAGTSLGSVDHKFFWVANGNDVNTNGFQLNQPDNLNNIEYCIELRSEYDFQWNDRYCDHALSFICRATKYYKLIPRNKK